MKPSTGLKGTDLLLDDNKVTGQCKSTSTCRDSDCYVLHTQRLIWIQKNTVDESETDACFFLMFNVHRKEA